MRTSSRRPTWTHPTCFATCSRRPSKSTRASSASTIDRAVRATSEVRAQVDALPRFVLVEGEVLATLNFSHHRAVATLVEVDATKAIAMARVFWRHTMDAIDHCDTLVECMIGVVISENALLAVESVLSRFDGGEFPERNELKAEVQRAFEPRPSLARAVESDYLFARSAIEELTCVSLDRVLTEAIMREYYEAMHEYAEGVARIDDLASDEGSALVRSAAPFRDGLQDEFSSFYNICGASLAETFWIGLADRIDEHRERVDELKERLRALR
ncbi:MAG: hypothetical protein AB8H86_30770 [Polyangiales bacterium]